MISPTIIDHEKLFGRFFNYFNSCLEYNNEGREVGGWHETIRPNYDAVKQEIKDGISRWCEQNGLSGCHNRIEFSLSDPFGWYGGLKIKIGNVSIYSSIGSIGKKVRWLNKITVDERNNLRTHVARTDERFLGEEVAHKFTVFIAEYREFLQDSLDKTWEVYQNV